MQILDDSESITKILVITIASHIYLTTMKTFPLRELQLQRCLMTTGIGTTIGIILEIEVEIKIGFEMTTLINDLESAVSLLTDPREVQETAPMDYDERMTDIGDLRTEAAQEVSHLVPATVRATLKIKLGARRAHRRQWVVTRLRQIPLKINRLMLPPIPRSRPPSQNMKKKSLLILMLKLNADVVAVKNF